MVFNMKAWRWRWKFVKMPLYSVDMTESGRPDAPSDDVARQVRELRKRRGWSAARLAEQCAVAGAPQLTAEAIGNIERGRRDKQGRRRRHVTVDELLAFAEALGVPAGMLLPVLVAPVEQGMTLHFQSTREFWAAQRLLDGFLTQVRNMAEELASREGP
jgi:transcriptional regulator with XRE-family HTH domain